jgi:hypothetical protein
MHIGKGHQKYFIFISGTSDVSGAKSDCNQCDNNNIQTIITGIVLGIIIILLATYAGYLTILMKRKEENKSKFLYFYFYSFTYSSH